VIKNEFFRLVKAKSSLLVIVLLVLIAVPSFVLSMSDKKVFEQQLVNPPEDINLLAVKQILAEYTGTKFVFDFLYIHEFYLGFCLLLILWIGIFLAVVPQNQKESGLGNFIIARVPYKKYLGAQLAAQSLCITCVVAVSTCLILGFAFFMGGMSFGHTSMGLYTFHASSMLLVVLTQSLQLIVLLVLMNAISSLLNIWIKNKYVLQAFPLCIFTLAPFIIGSTLANLFSPIGSIIVPFIPFQILGGVYTAIHAQFDQRTIVEALLPLGIYLVLSLALFRCNTKKHEGSYL